MKIVLAVILVIAVLILAALVSSWLISLFWWWVVPDVFAGAVKQGLLPATITLLQAFKFSCLLFVLGIASKSSNRSSKK